MNDKRLKYIKEKFSKNVSILCFFFWLFLPICITIRFLHKALHTPSKFYHLEIMHIWYEPIYTDTFHLLSKCTILLLIILIFCYLRNNYNRKNVFREKLTQRPWLLFLAALLLWACISTALSGHAKEEWRGTAYRVDGLFSYFVYASVFICAGIQKNEKLRKRIIQIFALVGNVTAILIVLQIYQLFRVDEYIPYIGAGTFFNTNHCAYYLTMTILCSIGLYLYTQHWKMRFVYGASIVLQFYALLKNNTFGCFLAVWITLPILYFILWKSGRKLAWQHLIPFGIIFILTVLCSDIAGNNFSVLFGDVQDIIEKTEDADRAGSGRLALWKYALSKIIQRPILGYGPEGLSFNLPSYIHNDRPHNEYLQYAAFLGIPGLSLYLSSLITLARSCWKRLKKLNPTTLIAGDAMIGYLISAFFGNTMFYTTPYFFMLFGMVAFAPNADD